MHQPIHPATAGDDELPQTEGEAYLSWADGALIYHGTLPPEELLQVLARFIADEHTYH